MEGDIKGSIQEVSLKSGTSYKASIDLPRSNGHLERETKTFPSKDEANQWLVQMNVMLMNGDSDDFSADDMLLSEYLEIWYTNHTNGLKQSTKSK